MVPAQPDECYLRSFEPGFCWLLPPTDMSPERAHELHDRPVTAQRPLEEYATLSEHASYHAGLIGGLMKVVAAEDEGVAETFRLGIHIMPHEMMISEIIQGNGRVEWKTNKDAA